MWGDTDKEERRRGGWRGQWLGAERDREGVAGRETDAPALLVMLAVVVLAVWDRRGRRTSQHFTLLSPPTWSSLCSAGFNPFFFACPSLSSLPSLFEPPPSPPSCLRARWVVYPRPGGSVQSWRLRAMTPLPAWCSSSRLPSCPDQPPPHSLLPLCSTSYAFTQHHSRTSPRHPTTQQTHTQKQPHCGERRHKVQTQPVRGCRPHTHTHIYTHTAEHLKVRNRACCSEAVNVWWGKCWECVDWRPLAPHH